MTSFTAEQNADIIDAYVAGASITQLASQYHCRNGAINAVLGDLKRPKNVKPTTVYVTKCPGCPMIFTNRSGRTYCTDACKKNATERERRRRFAEFEWIALTDSWDNVATRLGFTGIDHMRDWLRKLGEHKWAERMNHDLLPLRPSQRAA